MIHRTDSTAVKILKWTAIRDTANTIAKHYEDKAKTGDAAINWIAAANVQYATARRAQSKIDELYIVRTAEIVAESSAQLERVS